VHAKEFTGIDQMARPYLFMVFLMIMAIADEIQLPRLRNTACGLWVMDHGDLSIRNRQFCINAV